MVDTSALVVAEHIAGIDEGAPEKKNAEDKAENAMKSAETSKSNEHGALDRFLARSQASSDLETFLGLFQS